jgi:hypothetical protein
MWGCTHMGLAKFPVSLRARPPHSAQRSRRASWSSVRPIEIFGTHSSVADDTLRGFPALSVLSSYVPSPVKTACCERLNCCDDRFRVQSI